MASLDSLWRDVRFAFRSFRRTPTVTLTVVATLALALGLNATAFSVFNAYVLRPAAVRDADSLYLFTWMNRAGRGHRFTWQEFEQLRRDTVDVFSEVHADRKQLVTRIDGQPVFGQLVTANYFGSLGVGASRGRVLVPSDASAPRGQPVVVLSFAAWQRIFASDPAIVGKQIEIRGQPLEVVGVAPDGFVGLDVAPHDFWAPLTLSSALEDGPDLFGPEQPARLEVTGRLRSNQTTKSAEAALLVWAQRMTADNPEPERATRSILLLAATPIPLTFEVGLAFAPIAVAFGLVLLTACANIASLMLARVMARQREITIRLALGASRAQVVRQFLTESLLVALMAAGAGFVIADVTLNLGLRLFFATMPPEYADYLRLLPVPADGRVFVFMLGAGFLAALLFGLVPAFQATQGQVRRISHSGVTVDTRSSRLRYGLVVAQITASALLLICSGVLLRGADRVADVDLGLRTRDVIEIRTRDRSRMEVLTALEAETVVHSLAMTSQSPFSTGPTLSAAPSDGTNAVAIAYRFASSEYFRVLDIPLVMGRSFTQQEAKSGSPVVVLSQSAAQRLWPGQAAVGKSIRMAADTRSRTRGRGPSFSLAEVVGVARDVRVALEPDATSVAYLPTAASDAGNVFLVARVHGDPEVARQRLDALLSGVGSGSVEEIHKLDQFAAGRVYPFRVAYWLSGMVGALALLLTVSGIYSVLSYTVVQRRKEFGIRIALGATVGMVASVVLKQTARLSAIGLVAGTLLALVASRLLASTLVMIDTFDLLAYTSGLLVVLAACLAATLFPARRAARTEPLVAIHVD